MKGGHLAIVLAQARWAQGLIQAAIMYPQENLKYTTLT